MSGFDVQGVSGVSPIGRGARRASPSGGFAGELARAVKVSAHARQRLAQQNVPVDERLLSQLGEATDKVPVWRMISQHESSLQRRAKKWARKLGGLGLTADVVPGRSTVNWRAWVTGGAV